jgi:hypothetical protein
MLNIWSLLCSVHCHDEGILEFDVESEDSHCCCCRHVSQRTIPTLVERLKEGRSFVRCGFCNFDKLLQKVNPLDSQRVIKDERVVNYQHWNVDCTFIF